MWIALIHIFTIIRIFSIVRSLSISIFRILPFTFPIFYFWLIVLYYDSFTSIFTLNFNFHSFFLLTSHFISSFFSNFHSSGEFCSIEWIKMCTVIKINRCTHIFSLKRFYKKPVWIYHHSVSKWWYFAVKQRIINCLFFHTYRKFAIFFRDFSINCFLQFSCLLHLSFRRHISAVSMDYCLWTIWLNMFDPFSRDMNESFRQKQTKSFTPKMCISNFKEEEAEEEESEKLSVCHSRQSTKKSDSKRLQHFSLCIKRGLNEVKWIRHQVFGTSQSFRIFLLFFLLRLLCLT